MKTKLSLLLIIFLFTHSLFGQSVTIVSLTSEADAFVSSANASLNFGADSLLEVGNSNPSDVRRLFVRYDLSSIPSNAIITKAYFKLKVDSEGPNPKSFTLQMAKDEWVEGDINYDNQPAIETYKKLKINVNYNNPQRVFYVHQHVQLMVTGGHPNNGWMMAMDREIGYEWSNTFHSREAATSALRPELYIEYYVPFQFSEAVIEHATNSTSLDGSLDVTVTDGPSSPTFQWYDGSTGLAISGATSSTISNLAPGWYGLEVSGSEGSSEYMGFVVGSKNEPIQIEFNPGPNYIDDAQLKDGPFNRGVNQSIFPFGNYGSYTQFLANDGTYSQMRGIMKFRLWMHEDMVVNQADLTLVGVSQSTTNSNASTVHLISESWSESLVSYSNIPDYSLTSDLHLLRTTFSTESKTLDLRDYWEIWNNHSTQNFGFLLELDSYTNISAYMRFYSSDDGTASNRPSIQFDLSVEDGYHLVYDENAQIVSVDVDLSEIALKTPPYYYNISTAHIDDMDITYDYFNDSIFDGNLDSSDFFIGDTSVYKTFSNVPFGTNYLTVFDSNKNRILDKELKIFGNVEMIENDGFTLVRDELVSTKPNSKTFLKAFITNQSTGHIYFEPEDLVTKQHFGLVLSTASSNTLATDYSFGFIIENNNVECIIDGAVVGTFPITGTKFYISFINGLVELLMDEDALVPATLMTENIVYKSGIHMEAAEKLTKYDLLQITRKNFTCLVEKNDLECGIGDSEAGFDFHLTPNVDDIVVDNVLYPIGLYTYDWEVFKDGISLSSGTNSGATAVTIFNPSTYGPGVYLIVTTANVTLIGGPMFNESTSTLVYLGMGMNWENEQNIFPQTTSQHTKLNAIGDGSVNANLGVYGKAISAQKNPANSPGWISFTHRTTNSQPIEVNSFLLSENPQLGTMNITSPTNPILFFPTSGNQFYFSNPTTQTTNVFNYIPGLPLVVDRNSQGEISIKQNGNTIVWPVSGFYFGRHKASCYITKRGSGFENIVSSYECPPQNIQYAQLKYDLDGYYHVMKDNEINFVFNQEYESETLKFEIYNSNNLLVRTEQDYTPINTTHGKNYITLPVTSTNCIGDGHFFLIAKNEKKEKFYLRFHVEGSGCGTIPDQSDPPLND